jgi:hypothetical protein
MPELEKKKRELSEKRNLFKPLDRKEFSEHQHEYLERKKEMEEKQK